MEESGGCLPTTGDINGECGHRIDCRGKMTIPKKDATHDSKHEKEGKAVEKDRRTGIF